MKRIRSSGLPSSRHGLHHSSRQGSTRHHGPRHVLRRPVYVHGSDTVSPPAVDEGVVRGGRYMGVCPVDINNCSYTAHTSDCDVINPTPCRHRSSEYDTWSGPPCLNDTSALHRHVTSPLRAAVTSEERYCDSLMPLRHECRCSVLGLGPPINNICRGASPPQLQRTGSCQIHSTCKLLKVGAKRRTSRDTVGPARREGPDTLASWPSTEPHYAWPSSGPLVTLPALPLSSAIRRYHPTLLDTLSDIPSGVSLAWHDVMTCGDVSISVPVPAAALYTSTSSCGGLQLYYRLRHRGAAGLPPSYSSLCIDSNVTTLPRPTTHPREETELKTSSTTHKQTGTMTWYYVFI